MNAPDPLLGVLIKRHQHWDVEHGHVVMGRVLDVDRGINQY